MATRIGSYFAALPLRFPPGLLDTIKATAPEEGLRWFHPDDLHITLAFFGREDGERIPWVVEVLQRIPFIEMEITLGEPRLLPRRNRFSAISFEVAEGGEKIAEMIAAWRGPLLGAAGCEPDERPPLPHLTIARPGRRDPLWLRKKVARWAEALKPPAGRITVLPPELLGAAPEGDERRFRVIGED